MSDPPTPAHEADEKEPAPDPAQDEPGTPSEGEGAAEPQVTRPIPVRPPTPVRRKVGRPTTPEPVRAGLEGDDAGGVGAVEPLEVELELPDGVVTVRVRGRSRGHTSEGAADLLLLGFHRPGEEEAVREALVVGDSLEALSPAQLETAWERGREPRDPFEPSELFPDTSRSRGRGRGR